MAETEFSFYGTPYSEGCPACFRIEPQPSGLDLVYENDSFRVHQDYEIPIPGFMIIEAKRHVREASEFTVDERVEFMDAWSFTNDAIVTVLGREQITTFQESKSSHFHTALLPVFPWMTSLTEGRNRNIQQIMDYARENFSDEIGIKSVEEVTLKLKKYTGTE